MCRSACSPGDTRHTSELIGRRTANVDRIGNEPSESRSRGKRPPGGEDMERIQEWNELAAQLCVDSIRASTAAGSGHPTSSMSAAHLLSVLFSDHLRYDVDEPNNPGNDRFILSKGHASPLLYSVLRALGAITDPELLSFR